MFWFELWREYKLSIAEILSVFQDGKIIFFNSKILILDNLNKNIILSKANNIWWTIKIIEISNKKEEIKEYILNKAKDSSWKYKYGISYFWQKQNLRNILKNIKRYLKENNISSRFINKNFSNLSSAQIIWEKLLDKESDFSIIESKDNTFIGKTIWIQNIKNYSKRDYSKTRDMNIGMLPPKLSQIMINIANKWENINIFDPFVWLWTILIEWVYMWINQVYGSDFNNDMVDISKKNLENLKQKDFKSKIINFDARDIWKNPILQANKNLNIVTEWFLWEIMTKKNICDTRINIQRKNLSKLYEKFFLWLKQINFKWIIVISFPFWELNKKYIYFTEIYEIINKYSEILLLFPTSIKLSPSKSGSLLYKRQNQLVGREIFKLRIKN